MKTLPHWIGGGAKVSSLAYAIICDALLGLDMRPPVIAWRHQIDEADVLRAMAELRARDVIVE